MNFLNPPLHFTTTPPLRKIAFTFFTVIPVSRASSRTAFRVDISLTPFQVFRTMPRHTKRVKHKHTN